jgi:hypothetical protein
VEQEILHPLVLLKVIQGEIVLLEQEEAVEVEEQELQVEPQLEEQD